MRFDSLEFLLFIAVVFILEQVFSGGRRRQVLLLVVSYLFYASWNPFFVLLLLFSTTLDFCVGIWLGNTEGKWRRRSVLAVSLVGNLSVLAFYKYGMLFQDVAALMPSLDLKTAFPRRDDLIIPLGISFYTFQTISYTIDVYRKRLQPCRDPVAFALFVTFFPQLIAGPIMRAGKLLPQIAANRRATREDVHVGVELFLLGLFKKVVIADNLALLSDACFGAPESFTGWALALANIGFLIQIYCDFSGYSTMARGLGKLLGFELPRNFDYPYLAATPAQFMAGWHITMSQWFRDYVYLPLVHGRSGQLRMVLAILLTWTLFGVWHGGTINFLAWGLFNGIWLAAYRLMRRRLRRLPSNTATYLTGRVLMIAVMVVSSVLFRGASPAITELYFERMVRWSSDGASVSLGWLAVILFLVGIHMASKRWYREDVMARLSTPGRIVLVGGTSILISAFAMSSRPFVYFQF